MDANIPVRAGSPDIVPDRRLGAMAEGRSFPREPWCRELNEIYALSKRILTKEYLKSGVLVMSQKTLPIIEKPVDDVVYGHPQFEQSFLNATRVKLGIPLFRLTPDFNFIPSHPTHPPDWRSGYFVHLTGSRKKNYKYAQLWEYKAIYRKTFSQRYFISVNIRIHKLMPMENETNREKFIHLDPTDFHYLSHRGYCTYSEHGDLIYNFTARGLGGATPIAVYGPYVTVPPGRVDR